MSTPKPDPLVPRPCLPKAFVAVVVLVYFSSNLGCFNQELPMCLQAKSIKSKPGQIAQFKTDRSCHMQNSSLARGMFLGL